MTRACANFSLAIFQVNGTFVLKSGTDFRQFSKVTLDFSKEPIQVEIEAVDVTKSYEPDKELDKALEKYTGIFSQERDICLHYISRSCERKDD